MQIRIRLERKKEENSYGNTMITHAVDLATWLETSPKKGKSFPIRPYRNFSENFSRNSSGMFFFFMSWFGNY